MAKITIGMPTYDDFDGVYFSINAVRLYHSDILDEIEFLVVDNNPSGVHAKSVEAFVRSVGGQYIAFDEWTSTSVGKNIVFKAANTPYVVCIDSHVTIAPGAIKKLIEFFDNNPGCDDLIQGPLLNNNLSVSTHFKPDWSGQMWGVWATDDRGKDVDSEPFEIPMQGTGLIACCKGAWLGFNDDFRGFGAQAGYIHEKFRQAGHKTLCLPFLRWMHRFGRPMGAKYVVTGTDKFRNYVIGFRELGLPLDPVIKHFEPILKEKVMSNIIAEVDEKDKPLVACLMLTYNRLPKSSRLVNEAIESFLRQDYPYKELIIVNDCPGQVILVDRPGVVVANVSRRFRTLGEKFNVAASLTGADLLCIWDDDDISLPWRVSQAVNALKDAQYWQPEAHWALNYNDLTYIDRQGQLPAKGIFTKKLFNELGGFAESSRSIDRDFQNRALSLGGGAAIRDKLSPQDCSYIYRYLGTDSYHHTTDSYEKVGMEPVKQCVFEAQPSWSMDYVELVRNAGSNQETPQG